MSQQRIKHWLAGLLLAASIAGPAVVEPIPGAAHVAAAKTVTAASTALVASQASAPGRLNREVFGFALADSLSDPSVGMSSWNFSLLSTVSFFALHITSSGAIAGDSELTTWNSAALGTLVSTARSHGTKVVVTIDMQDFSPGTPTMCAALANRAATVKAAVAQVTAKGVDGLNVDYEGLNGTCPNGQTSRSMMTSFVSQLRAALPAGSSLTVDTYAGAAADPLGFFDIRGMSASVDAFFVMAYDLEYSNYLRSPLGCSRFCLGPTAPLSGYYYNDTSTAQQYTAVVPASKVILGVPYYGRKSCVGGAVPNGYPGGSVTADSYLDATGEATAPQVGAGTYSVHRDANDSTGHERWDTWYNTSLHCTRELYWDDASSLGAKYDLVNRVGLRGVGVWTLNYGGSAPELWAALASHFATCQSATLGSTPASPQPAGSVVTFTGAAQCANANPSYEFWMLPPAATTWQAARGYGTDPTFAWSTAGKAPGTYRVSVWVRDSSSAGVFANALGRWDASSDRQFTLTSSPCTATSLAAAPVSPSSIGHVITLTSSATGCPRPLYQFWLLYPGAGTWQIGQAYSPATTFSWNTAGLRGGTYRISVWVRDASSLGVNSASLGRWDASFNGQFLMTQPCARVSVSYSRPAPAPLGTTVTITATAVGCPSPNPQFQFWILPPGATRWQLAQAYSTAASLAWATSGKAVGSYRVTVWARDAASSGAMGSTLGVWDASNDGQYLLSPATPCVSAGLAYAPASPAKAGTSITVTASSSACLHPRYQFWMLAPGSATWQLVQAYSSSPAYTWNTTGRNPGGYRITAWVVDADSVGASGNSLGRWDSSANGQYTLG